MQIKVLSVKEHGRTVEARVRANADRAQIHVRVWFDRPAEASARLLWQRARDEALRYLDPA